MPASTETIKTESTKANDSVGAAGAVVVDLGKKRRKQIKQLREGRGKLMAEVSQLVSELRAAGSISAGTQPLVVVVRQKRKRTTLFT